MDLIYDLIPVLGYKDDLILFPLGVLQSLERCPLRR
ncbi:MAG: DUF1232 domain-containing protein [Chlorobiales bacterium]|nr:DUF1232 domain-containing protein [Chlorobiales bacterium]